MINNFEMRPYVIVILLFLIYGFPAFISLLFETETQISFNYVYLGVLMCLTQISNSLFSLKLSEKIDLNAGDISYTALLFTALFLVIAQPKPIVVRKMIFIFVMLSTFLFFIFWVLANILGNLENATNYYNIDPQLFHYSYKSLIYSIVLFTTETTILLFLLKKTLPYFKSKWASLIALTTIFLVVIVLDGVLYPAGINLLYGESLFSIKKGVIAKLIFGTGFGTMILVFLWIFPEKMKAFIAVDKPLRNYILPPKKKQLLKKLEKASKEIDELRKILPICVKCKKIRDDEGFWHKVEKYFSKHENLRFTHGYCPDCYDKVMKKLE